jgi:hypothetical protein
VRGRFQIRDRAGLEAVSCPCYARITAAYQRMQTEALTNYPILLMAKNRRVLCKHPPLCSLQGVPYLFRRQGRVYMADADVRQRVHHSIGDGHWGRQRGQLANAFGTQRIQG